TPPEPALRGGPRRPRAVRCACDPDPRRRAQKAGARDRSIRARLRDRALHRGAVPRARSAAGLSVGRPDHGHAAVGSDDRRGPCLAVLRIAPPTGRGVSMLTPCRKLASPPPGGGRSPSAYRREAGGGGSIDPTPRASRATLPLQGRVGTAVRGARNM